MEWVQIAGKLVAAGAPILGGMLLGPAGSTMGTVVGNIVAAALGVPPTPEAVSAAIDSDPTASDRIKAAESAHSDDLAAFQASLIDAQNARTMLTQLATAAPGIGKTVPILTYVMAAGFFLSLGLMFFVGRSGAIDPLYAQIVNIMIGALIGGFTQVLNFWFGTTKSSHDNGVAMRGIAATAPAVGAAALLRK